MGLQQVASAFRLDDEGWNRHANPWSGWTRFITCLPLLAAAIWSRRWLDWWSLLPIGLALIWIVVNPRVFSPVRDDDAWITRGVFGERLYVETPRGDLPARHRTLPAVLNGAAALGVVPLTVGLVTYDLWALTLGIALTIGGKLWYIDRMTWIYLDLTTADPSRRMPVRVSGRAHPDVGI